MHFNWIKQVKGSALGLLAMMSCLTACNDEDYLGQQSGSTLKINVTANAPIVSRSIINDTYLPDGHSIGISLFNAENGQDYDGQGYFNVKYTAAGEGSGQTWTSSSTVTLSSTPAKIIAYYPWSDDENFDITAVPVETASQTDYMYAKPIVGASFTSATVVLNMQHALTDIRVNISKGTYTGTGAVTKITAKAPAFATNATMSAVDGTLAGVTGGGSQFETELTDAAISTANVTHDFLVVPLANSTSGEVTIFVTIDDKKFTVNVPYTEAFQQGFTYLYNLVLDNEELVLNNVKVSKWDVVGNTDSEMQFVPTFAEDEYVVAIFGMVEEQDESNGDDGVADVSLFASRAIRNQKFDDIRKRMQDLNIKINTPVSAKKTLSRSSGSNNRSFDYIHNVVGFVGTIDWGDGTTDTYTEATDFPVHTYYQSGKFVVKTKGNIEGLIFPADAYDGDDEDYWFYIYKNSTSRICNIYQIGRQDALEIMYGAFDSASIAEIPEGLFDNCPNVTDFSGTFAYCYNLQSIPEGLFDNCSKVESFVGAFSECTSLTSIPVGLFDKCTKVTSFSGTFSGTDITNIPKGLFDKCTEVTDFSYAFQNCDNLVSIPKGLFDYNTEVTNFYGTFAGSENLFEIPQGLFNECINVKDFSYTFGQCISLKLIPDGLFKTCTQAEFFNQTFRNCTNLEVIGENIFNNPTVIGLDLTSTFEDCTNLTTISGNMFCENTKIYRLDYTFQFCENLIEIPAGLFDKCFVVEDKINCTFNGCKKIASIPAGLLDNFICEGFNCMFGNTGIKSIPEGLFDNNTNASSFDWMFSGCTSLTTIPEGLFNKCTQVTSFSGTFQNCTALTEIPDGLFNKCTKVTNFNYMFKGCTTLTTTGNYTFMNCSNVLNFYNTFEGCSSLKTIGVHAFDGCSKLLNIDDIISNVKSSIQTISDYAFANCSSITTFKGVLNGCVSLKTVGDYAFAGCTKVTSFEKTFYECTALESIGKNMFMDCTGVTSFYRTFFGCTALTEIPENLFKNCIGVLELGDVFQSCTNLINIPYGLFDDCTKVTSFGQIFRNCVNLVTIPEKLFDACTEVTNFQSMFHGCTNLQSIPKGLFDKCTKVTNFYMAFYSTAITEIPEGLFDKCTEVKSFQSAFRGCSSLTTIPEGLFDKCTKVTNFYMAFYGCANLTGESPYTTIQVDGVDTKVHLYKRSNYPEYFTAPTNYSDCFYSCTGLTDYSNIPSGWK